MRPFTLGALIIVAVLAAPALAKLPPLTDEAKAKATEAAAKASWADKVGLYQVCKSMDKVADAYRQKTAAAGKEPVAAVPAPQCTDPGPYAAPEVTPLTPAASKPLEASEAHSPSGLAVSPPSTNATSSQMSDGVKK
ncbi:MAG: hypothetical protein ABIV63_07710 [Caldimonas sp.]